MQSVTFQKSSTTRTAASRAEVVNTLVFASQALVGIAARSLAVIEGELTFIQFRALVWLAEHGPSNVSALAEAVGVHASTTTRLCDRLVDKALIERSNPPGDRREVIINLSPTGRAVIDSVIDARRAEVDALVAAIDPAGYPSIIEGFERFAEAAGELPDDAWQLGWSRPQPQ